MNEAAQNTDTEIWREAPENFYSPSIHVTTHGYIGIDVDGHVIVMSVRSWHGLGKEKMGITVKAKAG